MPHSHRAHSSANSVTRTGPRRLDAETYVRRFIKPPGPVDEWLERVRGQATENGRPFVEGGSVPMVDYGPQLVVCRVERVIHKPVDDVDSMFTESDKHELYLTTMSYIVQDSPFALRTSSRILLQSYVGSPEDLGAPLWTGLVHDLLEFVLTQAELSEFLNDFRKMEGSQYVVIFVEDDTRQNYLDRRTYIPTRRRVFQRLEQQELKTSASTLYR
ncbi:hypothetical protein APHAL10511_001500 [Amanita phalloides]|nr:hypothetical protein APHAL10511_001500 [Amanita phalloides]